MYVGEVREVGCVGCMGCVWEKKRAADGRVNWQNVDTKKEDVIPRQQGCRIQD